MHPLWRAQIVHLKADEVFAKVSSKYTDFSDLFSPKLAVGLSDHRSNDHAIKLEKDQQPSYGLIYSLGPIKLETLKTYIENNLANSFIKSFKSPIKAPILLNKKPNESLRLYIDYCRLNNLTIKNWYLLSLVRGLLDQLDRVRRFT